MFSPCPTDLASETKINKKTRWLVQITMNGQVPDEKKSQGTASTAFFTDSMGQNCKFRNQSATLWIINFGFVTSWPRALLDAQKDMCGKCVTLENLRSRQKSDPERSFTLPTKFQSPLASRSLKKKEKHKNWNECTYMVFALSLVVDVLFDWQLTVQYKLDYSN